ncbi:serine/arginine repetitive matrix protein 2 isoform X2 [Capsicum annuum]|uniref:serine/arginine repetitive matrix protein 2 isoform X2 n=1 Tax=Capsicum annuum TaxID=4072 RepID=UPI0007BF1C87|nr:serine/arginine repetitive matrix protein 2 isoform X2 [Capsicum annuum]XP_047264201.1 serine/arginine repetitive matrix protein 2 isoform X2 [Capsicum annuum]
MEDGIDADILMDYVEFQIFPRQNRFESHICYGNKIETASSGLLEQLILHSPKIKSLHSKGSDADFQFRPLGNLSDAKWFTKSTLIRFLHIISSSPIIDMAKAMVNEISQLEEARKFHVSLYTKGPQDHVWGGEAECDYSSDAVSLSQQENDNPSSDASKNELLRAMDLRLTALKGELAAAFDQAAGTRCSFEDIIDIEKFSYYFGAVELRNCLQKFITLSDENRASGFPGKELSLSKVDVRNDKVGSEGGNSQTSGPSKLDTEVKYSASPAKAAQMERQNSSGSEESSCTSEVEQQPSVERSRTLIRSASPRRSASPMRRVQIGRSGSRRSTALTIKSLNYFPGRERSISHKDAAVSGSDEEDAEQTSKKTEKDACRMSVQDAINLFESKQKGQAVDYQRTKSLLSASVGANKAVFRRWSSGVCESTKGSVDVASDDPVSEAVNKLEDQETESALERKRDSYPPPISHDAEAAAADFKQNSPEEKAYSPNVTPEESLPNQGEEISEKLNASIEWTRQKEAELNQLLTKMMETKPSKYRNLAASDSKNQSRPAERRGGFYDHYKEKRDEKLRGETARNRAEKDKQFKAMQQILDERKAEIVTGNANNVSKKTNVKRIQRTVKKSPESANTKDGTPKAAVAKKASSKVSQLPATRKSWPSLPSPRVAGTSTAKTPSITNSADTTTPSRRRSQPTTAAPQTSQKVEKLQPQAKSVKTPQNNIRKNVTNGNDKKQQTLTKASKPTKARVQPTLGDSAPSAKPRLNKVTKKSSVVPLESKEVKPFLRKGSGTGSGHSPVIKAKISSQPEKSLRESADFVQVEENEMASVASSPLNQLQDRGLEELKIHEDEDSVIKLNSPKKYEDRESCNKITPDNEDDFGRMEESALKGEVEEESNISPRAWVVIEEQEDQALLCNDGFGPIESLADVAVRSSSPRVRHSLSQMLLEESSEDVIDWGNAENPPTMVYQKDVPKGLKRLLKFARKSKTDLNSTGVSSPSVFSEGEEDPEDSKLLTKSSSDNLLRKATLHAKHSGQVNLSSEDYELSAQTSIGKIAAQKLQASRLSAPASTTKASRSFFSLSAFKGSK